mmetsp:Transcript_14555/g.29099  ORF Transcript_14555/g.29099 Transcript_14555/m.29099 type:complete len:166 (-) Transcript_14555:204-701(-)|eukprot:CAMPEP_0181323702 /NCGR_PEP_ID=MMETSP1101-20121128/19941_1 /TAXON_ID=46948 /ORGANISM="Rhodomonas abbreviata, Strain Caron Lab Isolate" /LENGTH=165 /DNA_ID=CAMNT_0023431777 /DNA_START=165 /DNA_END=662 /DNA_ORIENTATION=-
MSAYSATLSEEVITAAKHAFNRYDHDNSGTVSVEEICAALQEARKEAPEAQVFQILEEMGLADGSSGIRYHEFLSIIEGLPPLAQGEEQMDDDQDAFAASFQLLGGNPDDPESCVTKETIRKVLQEFELDDNVDKVLGTAEGGKKSLKANLNLADFKEVLSQPHS